MISKRKLRKFVDEEIAEIVKNTTETSDYAKTKGEFAKFFLLMRMAIKFDLYDNGVLDMIKHKSEEIIEECGS